MNHYKLGSRGSFGDTQPALWVSNRELSADHYALNYVTGASGSLPVPTLSQQLHQRTPTAPLSLSSSAYTPSGLAALQTSMRQPIPSISSNPLERSIHEEDWFPRINAPLNPPVQPVGASTFDTHEQDFSPVAAPMASMDTPRQSMPSPAWTQPVVTQPIHPPSTKGDSLLGEAMRQAQMGLFVVLGRE